MTEQWAPIVGYEGLYSASDLGRVRSEDRLIDRKQGPWVKPGIILSPFYQVTGHTYAVLRKDQKSKTLSVHKLVLEAFGYPRPQGMECRHLNGNARDNRLSNLCWGTHTQNMRDKLLHGTQPHGEKSHLAKLTLAAVLSIRADCRHDELIAEDHGVSARHIRKIRTRQRWAHV